MEVFDRLYKLLSEMVPPKVLDHDDEVYARGYEDAVAEMLDEVEKLDVEVSGEETRVPKGE